MYLNTTAREQHTYDAIVVGSGISGGWPKVLSNLKTFLETGRGLPQSAAAS